ncbi:hypothetical protein METESE_08470 [Mesoterricola sediminis]|uniref:Type II secretion system protein GspE N-terminal domain-containing protein n=2 Tax=Mesoterricola sediminis TaxID=2927980 RepID=A0AA48KB97_9BACT|nr:hypothetical protein METESE_08470 [Mesoterricola sediminis]
MPHPKKLGEMLVEAGLITVAQLQEALRYQKSAGGRMGSNLVAMGMITEASLMDFLAVQTGVPRLDVKNLEIAGAVLERIPRRLAEQMTILPVAFKEPKSLVLAMADPSDLNAVDSARFASGLNIEPMVASHSSLRLAIADQYRKLESGLIGVTVEVGKDPLEDGLPVNFDALPEPVAITASSPWVKRDPFFDGNAYKEEPANPFQFFTEAPPEPRPTDSQGMIIPARSAASQVVPPIENYGTRALVLGLIRNLQRRGILGSDEIQRLIINLVETGEISDPSR